MNVHHFQFRHAQRRFRQQGLTLIEISLVIALLLGLITVVFLGIGAYREGADKARCKMQLAQVQKTVRSHANLANLAIGAALAEADVFGEGKLIEVKPTCPSGGTYATGAAVPAVSELYMTCDWDGGGKAAASHILAVDDYKGW